MEFGNNFNLDIKNVVGIDDATVLVITGDNSNQVKALYNMVVGAKKEEISKYVECSVTSSWLPETNLAPKEQIGIIEDMLVSELGGYHNKCVIATFSDHIVRYLEMLANANLVLRVLDSNIDALDLNYPSSWNSNEYKDIGIKRAREIFNMKKEKCKLDLENIKSKLRPEIYNIVNNRFFNVKAIDIVDGAASSCDEITQAYGGSDSTYKLVYKDITNSRIYETPIGNVMVDGKEYKSFRINNRSSWDILGRYELSVKGFMGSLNQYITGIGDSRYYFNQSKIDEHKLVNLLDTNEDKTNG